MGIKEVKRKEDAAINVFDYGGMNQDDEGQHENYPVLSAKERSKGFVRPVYRSYKHVGIPGPKHELRSLTDEEKGRYAQYGYVKYEDYHSEDDSTVGKFWTQKQLDSINKGCGAETTMGLELCETYARSPDFYGATFCVRCNTHLPVGEQGEFVWIGFDGLPTEVRVGT